VKLKLQLFNSKFEMIPYLVRIDWIKTYFICSKC